MNILCALESTSKPTKAKNILSFCQQCDAVSTEILQYQQYTIHIILYALFVFNTPLTNRQLLLQINVVLCSHASEP